MQENMIISFLKIFENESLRWILGIIITALIAIIGLILKVWLHFSKERARRIKNFIDNFCMLYKNNGYKLELLIPAGVNTLKNDKEIKMALEQLAMVRPGHSLRNWKDRIEKIGYKKFFSHIAKSRNNLNKHSIETFLGNLEKL